MTERHRKIAAGVCVISLFWLGVLAGVSFLATPVKFLAPSLSLPVALDVGRQTFAALNPLELLIGLVLLGAMLVAWRRKAFSMYMSAGLVLLVVAQMLWLLPLLDSRVELILQGQQPPASMLHLLYIGFDLVKLLLLGCISGGAIRSLVSQHR